MEDNKLTKDGNGDKSGYGAGEGTGVENRGRTQDGNGDGGGDGTESSSGGGKEDGKEDVIGKGGGEAKKHNTRTRVVETGETGVERESTYCRQERVRSAAADPDNLENINGIGRKQGGEQKVQYSTQG